MIKYVIISRRKPGFSRERFFYEWAFIHVALMVLTRPSMQRFKRYVQHFGNADIPEEWHLLPRPRQRWESLAEHWIENLDTTSPGPEYVEQMQPHSFSDSAMEIVYLQGTTIHQRPDFRSGGIKLVHRLAAIPGSDPAEALRYWRDQHAPLVVQALKDRGLRRYEINTPCAIDSGEFQNNRRGSLFDKANIDPPMGMEELWFDSLEQALQTGRDPALRRTLGESYAQFADVGNSYALFLNERVVFDFVTPGEITPMPAVLDPESLEAQVFARGRPYHEPRL